MIHLAIQLSKYINILLIAFYTFYSFYVLGGRGLIKSRAIYGKMTGIIYGFHLLSFAILYMTSENISIIYLYLGQVIGMSLILILYQWIYVNISKSMLLHMMFLYTIGSVILTRLSFGKLSFDKVVKQSIVAGATLLVCLVVPLIIDKFKYLSKFGWLYSGVGILALLTVFIFGIEQYGAKNWIRIMGFSFQPSEFVKILFVFSMGALLSKSKKFKHITIVTILAAVHVLILVASRDLGGALIFFVTYIIMLYVATKNPWYFFAGLIGGSAAAVVAHKLFRHVRVRMLAWSNPWGYIDSEGYQITQSLFAIGTGGWFGMGLTKGLPSNIPIVESDFIFSAISEELGALFAIFLVFILLNLFIVFVIAAMKINDEFYRLITIGLAVIFVFQVFLSIGGVTKFIPLTGVTLPLISYGGSSILSTLLMFSIMQGLYVYSQDRNDKDEKRKPKSKAKSKPTKVTSKAAANERKNPGQVC